MIRAMFLGVALCVTPVVHAFAQTPPPGVCVILSVEGVAVVSAPGHGRRAAEVGLGLGRNATLRTDPAGRVTLQCDGTLRVLVGPATELTVLRLLEGVPQTFGMRLRRGIAGFLFNGGDDGGGVQVRTPSAVAAVRSTQWAMQVTDGASAVFAREGTVFVFGDTGTARLAPGDGVDVSPEGEVRPIVPWGQGRIDLFAALLGPDW